MASKLTVKHARKILGKLAENISDVDLEMEIKAAELLKVLYFSHSSSNNKTHGKS